MSKQDGKPSRMQFLSRFLGHLLDYYQETNSIDVIVVQQPDGSFLSSAFHVHFGKFDVHEGFQMVTASILIGLAIH